ncbi:alpha/beta fold hydrolase [Hyphomicrobium sulfonivorans]|uniref:alpha/beta fold hydrolase n=1 Tax=Hyphomicrobium sulfonivorans TaxID=121290 RepID=UPI0018E1D6D9|nr:alpha/beta hydrolase [Hyphomicrobium sulfonivorans]NSL70519.1 alpha/beta hydrolase [Hyphomicrobium sulfonivorans]
MIGVRRSRFKQRPPSVERIAPVRTFSSDGTEIAFLDQGEGEPVLLIHGFASNIVTNWIDTGWVRTLTEAGYRVIAYDNRGHGRSEKLYRLEDYGAPLMAEDACRLLDHLGIERAHVLGYSMGARISAFLGLAHPDRVRSLVFGGLGINMVRGLAGTAPIAHALEAASIDDVTNPTARTFRSFAEQTGSDLKALAVCIRSARAPLTADAVATLKRPVLVVVGDRDVIGGSADELAALIPGAQAVTLANRDHMKAVGDRKFKAAVLDFFAAVDAG